MLEGVPGYTGTRESYVRLFLPTTATSTIVLVNQFQSCDNIAERGVLVALNAEKMLTNKLHMRFQYFYALSLTFGR